jgi:hypothetical protein
MRHVGPTSHIAHRIFIPSSNFNLSRCYGLIDIRYVRGSFVFSCRQPVQYEYRVATYSLTRYPIVHRQLPKTSATSELVLERSSGTLRSFTQHHITTRPRPCAHVSHRLPPNQWTFPIAMCAIPIIEADHCVVSTGSKMSRHRYTWPSPIEVDESAAL